MLILLVNCRHFLLQKLLTLFALTCTCLEWLFGSTWNKLWAMQRRIEFNSVTNFSFQRWENENVMYFSTGCCRSWWLEHGNQCQEFRKKLNQFSLILGCKHAVFFNDFTLHLSFDLNASDYLPFPYDLTYVFLTRWLLKFFIRQFF